MLRILTAIGALAAGLAVVTGAMAAHALEDLPAHQLEWWETAAAYHMYHALGMLLATWGAATFAPRVAMAAWVLFLLGIVLFSGSLYFMAVSERLMGEEQRWLGAVTPFGGVSFIVGWVVLAVAAAVRRDADTPQR